MWQGRRAQFFGGLNPGRYLARVGIAVGGAPGQVVEGTGELGGQEVAARRPSVPGPTLRDAEAELRTRTSGPALGPSWQHSSMSYDLEVYAAGFLDVDELRGLVGQISGLEVDDVGVGRSLTVSRGARRRYSFTIDGPDRAEAEDVPAEVTGTVLGVHHRYSVMVEGSAVRFPSNSGQVFRQLSLHLSGTAHNTQGWKKPSEVFTELLEADASTV